VRLATLPLGFAALAVGLTLAPAPASSQQQGDLRAEILESQRRLEQIRAERELLEREIGDVRNRARDAAQELANVERRLSASMAVLAEVEFQSEATAAQVESTTRDLIYSQDRLAESRAVLSRRLRDIYKMGPLQTVQALLGARSFADLLNRYRYLQQIADSDRQLVERVRALESRLAAQNHELQQRMTELGLLRQDRVSEVAELRAVEGERETALREFRSREARASNRLEELEGDEARMTTLIDELEERRRTMEAARARTGGPALTAADAGSLDWPIDGRLIYRFGRDQRPNGMVLRWNGIGLAAPTGTPVRAVKAGRVALAGPFEGYGPTVVLSHGDGFYTLYLYLEEIGVVEGRDVAAGQVVGTVGGADTPEGPHLEFQIRAPLQGSSPQAQDPLQWLRPQG
jgi:septal ring factor EnvC (AmiA/AmiB activator)